MVAKNKIKGAFIAVLFGRIIIGIGAFICFFAIVAGVAGLFAEDGGILASLQFFYEVGSAGLGICGFGAAVSKAKRWHLFALLNIVFFGSFVVGLFSMVGRVTSIGYYIWAFGGVISLSLILIMFMNWENLEDG